MIPRVSSHRALLAAVAILLFWQVVALWPSSTPVEDSPGNPPNAPQALKTEPAREAPTFRGFSPPVAAAPDYSIQRFRYVSVSTGQKQWQLLARSADFYSDHDTVLAQEIQAELFSNDLKQTLSVKVTGREARYLVSTRELEVGGNVRASFPDGSEIQSDYLRFDPKLRRVLIPTRYFTQGKGPNSKTTQISFTSQGLEGSLDEGHFVLPANVMIEVSKQALARHTSEHPSHHSAPAIFRASKAELWNPQRLLRLDSRSTPLKDSFVTLEQSGPNELRARARRMEIRGVASSPLSRGSTQSSENEKERPSFLAEDDVKIEEWTKGNSRTDRPYRHSTSGQAEFSPETDSFVLTEYPQVYQEDDTMTGDIITIYRREDRVEIENPNAITRGSHE